MPRSNERAAVEDIRFGESRFHRPLRLAPTSVASQQ